MESRVIGNVILQGNADDALRCFFNLALPDVPAGPAWLHEIAMAHFDYLSDGDQGWLRDLDALLPVIPAPDRRQAALTLHGWYDRAGRYCYDVDQDQLAETLSGDQLEDLSADS